MAARTGYTYPYKGKDGCAVSAVAVAPNDSTVVAFDALYIGVTGNVVITDLVGNVATFSNVPVGWFPVSCVRVMAATTATSILGLQI